jgi:histidine transport system permease protein
VFLDGYGPLILTGTWMTVKLGVLSLAGSMAIGLAGASCKLSKNQFFSGIATAYTTLIRSVPDLVLMLLIFFSLQIVLNRFTDWLAIAQIDINPFSAGVMTLCFIYGAYFTETFRGAFLSVPLGQTEAGVAYGMSRWMVFRRILFPQMMRFAVPGIGNNWQVLIKSTALVSIIGLNDLLRATQDAGKGTTRFFYFSIICALVYLAITTISNVLLIWIEQRYSAGLRRAR